MTEQMARYPDAPRLPDGEDVRTIISSGLSVDLEVAYRAFRYGLYRLLKSVARATDSDAPLAIFNHASNDAMDLLVDSLTGRGRPAARAARALFEHDVNLADVLRDPTLAQRYLDHELVAADLLGRRQPGASQLTGKARSKRRKLYRDLAGRARRELPERLARYGASFRRGWRDVNLRDRAASHGIDGYEAYQILSGVLHGSSGGLIGTVRAQGEDGTRVYRLGSSLELASLAYLEGLTSFRRTVDRIQAVRPESGTKELLSSIDALLAVWPEVDAALVAADEELWPHHGRQNYESVLCLYPNGHRWYVHDPETNAMARAVPPERAEKFVREVRDSLASRIADYDPAEFEGRPISLNVSTQVELEPHPDSRWFHAEAVLVPRRLQPNKFLPEQIVDVPPVRY